MVPVAHSSSTSGLITRPPALHQSFNSGSSVIHQSFISRPPFVHQPSIGAGPSRRRVRSQEPTRPGRRVLHGRGPPAPSETSSRNRFRHPPPLTAAWAMPGSEHNRTGCCRRGTRSQGREEPPCEARKARAAQGYLNPTPPQASCSRPRPDGSFNPGSLRGKDEPGEPRFRLLVHSVFTPGHISAASPGPGCRPAACHRAKKRQRRSDGSRTALLARPCPVSRHDPNKPASGM